MAASIIAQPLNFYLVSNPSADPCGICHGSLDDETPVVEHEGQGHLHPLHRDCMQLWDVTPLTCPLCRENVRFDPDVLYSRTEKIANTAKEWISNTKVFMNETARPEVRKLVIDVAANAGVVAIAKTVELSPLFLAVCLHVGAQAASAVRLGEVSIANREIGMLCGSAILANHVVPTAKVAAVLLAAGAGAAIDKFTQKSFFTGTFVGTMLLDFNPSNYLVQREIGSVLFPGLFSSVVRNSLKISFKLLDRIEGSMNLP